METKTQAHTYSIGTFHITQYDQPRMLTTAGEIAEHFTKMEYMLLDSLLVAAGSVVSNRQLLSIIHETEADDKAIHKALRKHVDNLRPKLRPFRLSIHRVRRYGYILLPMVGNEQA